MAGSDITEILKVFQNLLLNNGFTPLTIGNVPAFLTHDSEDVIYRNAANEGRIDCYNVRVEGTEEKRICNKTRSRATVYVDRYYEIRGNENWYLKVGDDIKSFTSYIESVGDTLAGAVDQWNYGSTTYSVAQIGNTKCQLVTVIFECEKERNA